MRLIDRFCELYTSLVCCNCVSSIETIRFHKMAYLWHQIDKMIKFYSERILWPGLLHLFVVWSMIGNCNGREKSVVSKFWVIAPDLIRIWILLQRSWNQKNDDQKSNCHYLFYFKRLLFSSLLFLLETNKLRWKW